jgi:hypothetical protein
LPPFNRNIVSLLLSDNDDDDDTFNV